MTFSLYSCEDGWFGNQEDNTEQSETLTQIGH